MRNVEDAEMNVLEEVMEECKLKDEGKEDRSDVSKISLTNEENEC